MNNFDKGSGNFIYIVGTIASGNAKCGNVEVYQDGILMKFNIAKRKPVWIVKIPENQWNELWVTNSQKIFLPIDEHSINIYDSNGNPSSTTLSFIDPIVKDYIPHSLNRVDGTIYLNMEGYFAMYTIPSIQFVSGFVDQFQEEPERFNLYQNYFTNYLINYGLSIYYRYPDLFFYYSVDSYFC